MGVWIDILNCVARGEPDVARCLLGTQLLSALLDDSTPAEAPAHTGDISQKGPLTRAIDIFFSTLYGNERAQAEASRYELRDCVIDAVVADIEESIRLVELCCKNPQIEFEAIVASSFWKSNLDRSLDWKRSRAADLLRSMLDLGVRLPSATVLMLADKGVAKFRFDEIANAVSQNRIRQTWQDFRKKQELSRFFCIVDSDRDAGIAAEGIDYGSITISRVALKLIASDSEISQNLEILSETLGPELTKLMEEMHSTEPDGGYKPIAWHGVFWDIYREYEYLRLELERRDPECKKDEALLRHISENYPDVRHKSRPSINRRRNALEKACKKKVQECAREKYYG